MSEIPYIDQLLKAEKDATDIIEKAQKERYTTFNLLSGRIFILSHLHSGREN